jgi:hypothetical protein
LLWDLKPIASQSVGSASLDENAVIAFAVENVLEVYRNELQEQRQRNAEIKHKYGLQSLGQMIMESDAKLIEYETRRSRGNDVPEATIQNELRTKEDLLAKKRKLEDEIRWETSLLPQEPRILGVARVVPQPATEGLAREDEEVEAVGMRHAMEHERRQGRLPEDVSAQNLGYDIRSTGAGIVRYIEVKARASTGAVALTPNEWLMAHRLGSEYWLYVVENAASAPTLYLVRDPAAKLRPNEVVEVVRFVVSDWKQAAEVNG